MNSLKDLYLVLEEENLTGPAHQADKRAASEEQPSSPTIKVGETFLIVQPSSHFVLSAVSGSKGDLKWPHFFKPWIFPFLYCCKNVRIPPICDCFGCLLSSPVDECCQQHPGGPEDGAAGSQRGVATGTTRLPGTHPAVCKGQSIMGSWEECVKEPRCSGITGIRI